MHWASTIISVILLMLCLAAIGFYGYAMYAAKEFFAHAPQPDRNFHPPLTILKPIHGLDGDAYANLAAFCQQAYPRYQIICGAREEKDPGVEVVKRIISDFPTVDIRLVVSDRTIGTNPKVSNLANMAAEARYPLLLICDSDIRVGLDYLARVVQPLCDPVVGVVTCMYRSLTRGLVGAIEALGISTDFQAGVLVARKLEGMKFALGSTVLIRRAVLDAIGGWPSVADYLADDFLLGSLPARAGYAVVLSDYVVEHTLAPESFAELIRHQTRWSRTMRTSRPWGYLGLMLTHGTAMSVLFLLASVGSTFGGAILAVTWLVRLTMAWVVGARCLHDESARKFLWLVPVRDLLSFMLWGYSFVGNTIDWRGQRFKLAKGGKLIPLGTAPPIAPSSSAH